MSVSIKPLEDRIVIKQVEAEQTTSSGLVIPDTAKEKPQEGEVIAIGPGRIDDNGNRVPLDVAVGDKVIYSKYGGTEVKYSGDEYLILSARDVERDAVAVVVDAAGADSDDFTLLGLLLGSVGDDEATCGGLLGLDLHDDAAVLERLDGNRHGLPLLSMRQKTR